MAIFLSPTQLPFIKVSTLCVKARIKSFDKSLVYTGDNVAKDETVLGKVPTTKCTQLCVKNCGPIKIHRRP